MHNVSVILRSDFTQCAFRFSLGESWLSASQGSQMMAERTEYGDDGTARARGLEIAASSVAPRG